MRCQIAAKNSPGLLELMRVAPKSHLGEEEAETLKQKKKYLIALEFLVVTVNGRNQSLFPEIANMLL